MTAEDDYTQSIRSLLRFRENIGSEDSSERVNSPRTNAIGSDSPGGRRGAMAAMSSIGIPVLPGLTITTSVASDTNPPAHDRVQHVSLVRRLWLRSGAVLDALGRCWFLIATFLVAAIFLVRVPQGLEALVAGIDPREYALGGLVYFTASMAAMQAALFASLLLEQPPIEDGEDVRAAAVCRLLRARPHRADRRFSHCLRIRDLHQKYEHYKSVAAIGGNLYLDLCHGHDGFPHRLHPESLDSENKK